jgi:hypothetical protein
VPAVAAPAPAFRARRLGVDKAAVDKELFKSGHRFRQQGVCISGGGTRLGSANRDANGSQWGSSAGSGETVLKLGPAKMAPTMMPAGESFSARTAPVFQGGIMRTKVVEL